MTCLGVVFLKHNKGGNGEGVQFVLCIHHWMVIAANGK